MLYLERIQFFDLLYSNHGPTTVKRRMWSLLVVEAKPVSERLAGLTARFEFPQGNAFPFH